MLQRRPIQHDTEGCEVISEFFLQRAQEAGHRCNTLSMADMHNLISLKVPRKTLKAITPGDAETGLHPSHCPENDLLRDVREDRGGVPKASRHDGVDDGMSCQTQRFSLDETTQFVGICLGFCMDEDDAGLNDDDNLSPTEEADATGTRPPRTSNQEDQTSEVHGSED